MRLDCELHWPHIISGAVGSSSCNRSGSNLLERSQPAEVDLGYLAAFDNTPIDPDLYTCVSPLPSVALQWIADIQIIYRSSRESHLLALTLTSTTTLLNSLFALPKTSLSLGPVVRPPAPTTTLPREKPLPKPKPPTKWERFAKEKGISHKRKEKVVWDEEKQDWVNRWGRGGKNKEAEDQWLHEVKAGDGELQTQAFESPNPAQTHIMQTPITTPLGQLEPNGKLE